MILLDTHALIWFLTNSPELSNPANKVIRAEYRHNPILVSVISIWEICHLVKQKKLVLEIPLNDWLIELKNKLAFQFVPIDYSLAYTSHHLPGSFHKDPADRFIVATALSTGATLITKDTKIRRYKHVKTLW